MSIFEKIIVEYPPENTCTYPEYKGKPYFSIMYEEDGEHIVGYGTYNPEVLSRYLRHYFMDVEQRPEEIKMREATQEEREEYINSISEDVREEIGVGKNYNPKGRTESAMIVMGDVLKEAYCSGYADGLSDRIESDYDRGLHDAWNAARKICAGNFAGKLDTGMILNISASDAIETIKLYEAAKEEADRRGSSIVPVENMFVFVNDLKRKGIYHCTATINEGKALIEWRKENDGNES